MNDKTKRIGRYLGCLGGAIFAPLVIYSTYLLFTRHSIDTGASDWVALVISSLVGVVFIVLLPIDRGLRAALAAVYIPLCGVTLFFYTFYFFGDWL